MPISKTQLHQALDAIAGIKGLYMDPDYLVEDIVLLSVSFPNEDEFKAAVVNTVNAIQLVRDRSVTPSLLENHLGGWRSYHFQHRVAQRAKADCRLIFRPIENGIEVKGFGHRYIPQDVYRRLVQGRSREQGKAPSA